MLRRLVGISLSDKNVQPMDPSSNLSPRPVCIYVDRSTGVNCQGSSFFPLGVWLTSCCVHFVSIQLHQ